MIIFNTDLKYISETHTLTTTDATTDAKINELSNDIEFYRLMQYQNEPSNEEK